MPDATNPKNQHPNGPRDLVQIDRTPRINPHTGHPYALCGHCGALLNGPSHKIAGTKYCRDCTDRHPYIFHHCED